MSAIDLFSVFAVDATAEKDGVLTQIPNAGDTRWLIARTTSVKYQTALQKAVKRNKPVLDSGGEAAKAKSNEILADVMAKTILLGWEGEVMYKGKPMTYSVENARLLLSHPDFLQAVTAVADSMEAFKAEKDEEDEKN